MPGQMDIFTYAGITPPEEATDVEDSFVEYEEVTVKKPRRKKRTFDETFSGIKIEEVVDDDLTAEEKQCPECGTEMVPIGKELAYEEVIFKKPEMRRIRHYTVTYGCPSCKTDAETPVFIKSRAVQPLIPHSYASSSVVAWTMYQKYVNSVPCYRQEKDWEQYGAKINRNTLGNWIIFGAEEYFIHLYNFFHRKLLERKFLMADETRIQVLKEPERNPTTDSFMWLFRTGEDGQDPIIIYRYTETRAKYNAKEFPEGFSGYLETDGYQGYNNLPGVSRCACWAHLRRYFKDAIPKGSENDVNCPAVQGFIYCSRLFNEERISKEKGENYKQRYKRRQEKEKPVTEAFFAWLDRQRPAKGTRMDTAVKYARNRAADLTTYLEDGRCSLSNNLAENSIRPFAVGRRNWLFADTPKGADANAIVYTMVEMAKAYGLNIYEYLKFLLDKRPMAGWSDEQFEEIAPWSEAAKQACGNGRE